jgi:hypothetical protein
MAQKEVPIKRTVKLNFWVTPDEELKIRERMTRLGISNISAYFRKVALDGYVINLDLSGLQELIYLLRKTSVNVNQVAKHCNEVGGVMADDVEYLKSQLDNLWGAANSVMKSLAAMN